MIRASTDIAVPSSQYQAASKERPVQNEFLLSLTTPIQDKVTISANAFKVDTGIEDYLPQSRDKNKKEFKNVKEYAEYLLMLIMKLRDLKPKPGELNVKMEDQAELQKALKELGNIKLS